MFLVVYSVRHDGALSDSEPESDGIRGGPRGEVSAC